MKGRFATAFTVVAAMGVMLLGVRVLAPACPAAAGDTVGVKAPASTSAPMPQGAVLGPATVVVRGDDLKTLSPDELAVLQQQIADEYLRRLAKRSPSR
jgi:hypothetical protein